MSNECCEDFEDISKFEIKFREILAELQCKTDTLEKTQRELFETQNLNCQLQILVENEKRITSKIRQEVQTAVEVIGNLENDKIRRETERARLEITWGTFQAERTFLIEQAKKLKFENIELKRKNEILESKITEKNMLNQSIEISVNELKRQLTVLQSVMKSNLEKLKREQDQFVNSFKTFSHVSTKIENVSKVILTNTLKYKKEIDELKQKLAVMEMTQTPVDSLPISINPTIEFELNELSEKLKLNTKIDDKLNEICKKLLLTNVTEITKQNK